MVWIGQSPPVLDHLLHLNVPCSGGGSPAYLEIDKLPDGQYRATVGKRVFLAALFGLVLLRIGTVFETWERYAHYSAEIESSFPHIEPGSKILIARSGDLWSVNAVESMPCLAVIERSSLESLVFSAPGQQVLVVNTHYRDRVGGYNDRPLSISDLLTSPASPSTASPDGRIYWQDWGEFYDYLYVLGSENQANPIPEKLQLLQTGEQFQLFRILR
jgi:hypothetical protein